MQRSNKDKPFCGQTEPHQTHQIQSSQSFQEITQISPPTQNRPLNPISKIPERLRMTTPQTSRHAHTVMNWPHPPEKTPAQNRKGQLSHVPNVPITKRNCPSPPDDLPSLHRREKAARVKHRTNIEVHENPTHKPEDIPTLILLHKRHSPIQPCWFIPQPASPAGIARRPGFIPK